MNFRASGNFIIGNDLSLEEFDEYIKPYLKKYGIIITDYLPFIYRQTNQCMIALSAFSKCKPSLEKRMEMSFNDAIKNIGEKTEKGEINYKKLMSLLKKLGAEHRTPFKTAMIYLGKTKASNSFPELMNMFYRQ